MGMSRQQLVAVDFDSTELAEAIAEHRLQLRDSTHDRPQSRADAARHAAMVIDRPFSDLVRQTEIVLIVFNLSGDAGSGAAPVLAASAVKAGATVVSVVAVREPKESQASLDPALSTIQATSHTVVPVKIEGNDVRSLHKAALGVVSAVRAVADSREGTSYRQQYATDLVMYLSNARRASFVEAQAKGVRHASKAVSRLLSALSPGELDDVASFILVVRAGADETEADFDEFFAAVAQRLPLAQGAFGAAYDPTCEYGVYLYLLFTTHRQHERYSPRHFVVWNPTIVSSRDYAALVTALGDIARAEGGLGVRRIDGQHVHIGVRELVPM